MRRQRIAKPVLIGIAATLFVTVIAPSPAYDPYDRLKASRDAMLSQQREVQRSYNEVNTQIDELRRQQSILEQYLQQLDRSIRDVDRAMGELK